MAYKQKEYDTALELRKQGKSYNEILQRVAVAKSTLSLWLSDLPLTPDEERYLKTRTNNNISRGRIKAASELRKNRIKREQQTYLSAQEEFKELCDEPRFLLGVMLYWAEGSSKHPMFQFTNSNPILIRYMYAWIQKYILKDQKYSIKPRLYIHKAYAGEDCEQFWADLLGIQRKEFAKTVYKPSMRAYKKNPNYKGCLRLDVGGVDNYRRVMAWKKCLGEYILAEQS